MKRGSASFEQWVDRAFDDERDYDTIAAESEDRLMDRADQERKGAWK